MSTNTTSTSDRIATDTPTSSSTPGSAQEAGQQEGTRRYEGISALMSAVPDPAVIEKLTNEFFAALPGAALPANPLPLSHPPDHPPEGAGAIPAVPSALPDFPREMFSFPAIPNPRAVAGVPVPPSSPPTGALNEADFRAIVSSLSGAIGLVPASASAVSPVLPGVSSSSVETQKGGPWATAPQIPPAAQMYSFPGVPAVPSSPPTGPPSGSDLASAPSAAVGAGVPSSAGRTDPWAEDPHFAGLNDVFSFPRVPGASVPGIPLATASQPSLPASQPVLGTIPAAPGDLPAHPKTTIAPDSTPALPKSVSSSPLSSSAATPAANADFSTPEKPAPFTTPTNFPSVSQLFSFPGVPGAQSPPGVPILPSSVPTKPANNSLAPAEADLGVLPGTLAGASATPSLGVRQPTLADSAGNSSTAGIEPVEFRPDLEPAELGVGKRPLDPRLIRQDFPILQERVHGRQLIWLDNAATTQKPNAVIDRLSYFYRHENSNVHRAAHTLAARATDAYESAREKTRRFLNAPSTREIVFVRGTTEGINLVAKSWGHRYVQKDDEVVITWLEHHANIVPWQQLCSEKGARLRVAPVNDRGEVILEEYEKLLTPRTRIVSFSQVSNALGTITPAREMAEMAHRYGARVLVDGAQAVSHMRADVQALDCDFYVFSGHKVFGPTGIGVVYGKAEVLDTTPPWQGGGNMIVDVTFERTSYQAAPARFEAGTGNIADAVGLGAALDYVEQVGIESIAAYEHELMNYATAGLLTVPGLKFIGTAREKAGVLSFILDDVRTEDVGAALNQEGIAVRSGHHCAQPILRRMGVEASVRASLALYNTCEEIDALVDALQRLRAGHGR